MAVALPPPLTPEPGKLEELRAHTGSETIISRGSYRLHVFGTNVLSHDEVQAAASQGDTLSNAVRALGVAYYRAGYPAAQLTYALNGRDLYILVTLGRVSSVTGPDYLHGYFSGIEKADPLTDSALERRRVLASPRADRAGEEISSTLTRKPDGSYNLDLQAAPDGPNLSAVRAEFGNPGNRFVGRYFVDLDVKQDTIWGDEFRFIGRRAVTSLNRGGSDNNYGDEYFSWNHVTPLGIFGLSARQVNYHLQLPDKTQFNGDIVIGDVSWFDVFASDFSSRWSLQLKLDRVDHRLDRASNGRNLQHELYNSGELATVYERALTFGEQKMSMQGGITVRKGLTANGQRTLADLEYLAFRPSLHVALQTSLKITAALDASGQFTRDTMPEEQQWVLGGQGNLTAYLPGVVVGDTGGLVRGTLEYAVLDFGPNYHLLPKIFSEYGFAELETPVTGQNKGRPSLADAGLELTFGAFKWFEAGAAYAVTFYDRDVSEAERDANKAHLFFRLTARF